MVISDNASRALYGACVTRGKAKGLLLKSAPKDPLAKAAWYGAQMVCNPYKVSISALLFMSDEQRTIFNEIEKLFDWLKANRTNCELLDQDRLALEKMGAW
jgi:hypothetical protein